jgi:hypothetical protein
MRKAVEQDGSDLARSLMATRDTTAGLAGQRPGTHDIRILPKTPVHVRILSWIFISRVKAGDLPEEFDHGARADFIGRLAYRSWNREYGEIEDCPEYCPHHLSEGDNLCVGHAINSNIGCHYCKRTGDYDPDKAMKIDGLVDEYKNRHGLHAKFAPCRSYGDF